MEVTPDMVEMVLACQMPSVHDRGGLKEPPWSYKYAWCIDLGRSTPEAEYHFTWERGKGWSKESMQFSGTPDAVTGAQMTAAVSGVYWMPPVKSRDELQEPEEPNARSACYDLGRSERGEEFFVFIWTPGKGWSKESVQIAYALTEGTGRESIQEEIESRIAAFSKGCKFAPEQLDILRELLVCGCVKTPPVNMDASTVQRFVALRSALLTYLDRPSSDGHPSRAELRKELRAMAESCTIG